MRPCHDKGHHPEAAPFHGVLPGGHSCHRIQPSGLDSCRIGGRRRHLEPPRPGWQNCKRRQIERSDLRERSGLRVGKPDATIDRGSECVTNGTPARWRVGHAGRIAQARDDEPHHALLPRPACRGRVTSQPRHLPPRRTQHDGHRAVDAAGRRRGLASERSPRTPTPTVDEGKPRSGARRTHCRERAGCHAVPCSHASCIGTGRESLSLATSEPASGPAAGRLAHARAAREEPPASMSTCGTSSSAT